MATKNANDLKIEYGIPELDYYLKGYCFLSDEKRIAKAEDTRLKNRYGKIISQKQNISFSDAVKKMERVCKKYDISYKTYTEREMYSLDEEGCENQIKKIAEELEKWKSDCQEISRLSGWSIEKTERIIKNAFDKYNISSSEFIEFKGWKITERELSLKKHKKVNGKPKQDARKAIILELTQKRKKKQTTELKSLKSKYPELNLTFAHYFENGFYELNHKTDLESISEKIELLKKKNDIVRAADETWAKIHKDKSPITDILEYVEPYCEIEKQLLSRGYKKQLFEMVRYAYPVIEEDEVKCEEIVLDMVMTKDILRFALDEYVTFHFFKVPVKERLAFMSHKATGEFLNRVSPKGTWKILIDKYKAYKLLEPYYGRKIVEVNAGDYDTFVDFCKTHPTFVAKENDGSLGRGVKKVTVDGSVPLRTLYEEVSNENHYIILEELVFAHESIKQFNPSSVNVVRFTVAQDHNSVVQDLDSVVLMDCFFKMGRKGSFVDNGGAGGVMGCVNKKTGQLEAIAYDEKGYQYTQHPDSGIKFEGFQLPDWDLALETVAEALRSVPNLNYAGFDLAYNADGKWVMIEGNAKPQLLGQANGVGLREAYNRSPFKAY